MTNRRKFIMQTGLAATAVAAANPINAIAKYSSTFTRGGFHYNSITFLHTTGTDLSIAEQVNKISGKNTSLVILHTAKDGEAQTQRLNFDISHDALKEKYEVGYKIIEKDNIKVGVIAVDVNEQHSTIDINDLATRLKKEKDCHLVVCISELGYKNKNKKDDITLAGKSENIDIIVGKHTENSPKYPMVAWNKNKAEVIIHHTNDTKAALGKIKVGFDQSGNKFNISF